MFKNSIVFEGALVRKSELYRDNNDRVYSYVTFARNYSSYNQETKQWEDIGTSFVECRLSNNVAEAFDKSNFKNGTRFLISGVLSPVAARKYTNNEGKEIEVPFKENVKVEHIGYLIKGWQTSADLGGNENPEKNQSRNTSEKRKESPSSSSQNNNSQQDGYQSLDVDDLENFFD